MTGAGVFTAVAVAVAEPLPLSLEAEPLPLSLETESVEFVFFAGRVRICGSRGFGRVRICGSRPLGTALEMYLRTLHSLSTDRSHIRTLKLRTTLENFLPQ